MKPILTLLLSAAGLLSIGCPPKPVPEPPPPVVVVKPRPEPRLEATLASRPGPAQVSLDGKDLGQTPRVVKVDSWDDVFRISAVRDREMPAETRIRVVSDRSMEVTFLFQDSVSPMAKALGLPRIMVFDYGSALTFDVDRYELSPAITPALDHQADMLIRHFAGIPIFVCGHTDITGSASHNAILSLRRAEVVTDYLVARGVSRQFIKTQGFGSTYPVAGNDTLAGRALNRRTEIILPQ
jgi:outer membrane protein OmpA-like peptidoglycan-associated protein